MHVGRACRKALRLCHLRAWQPGQPAVQDGNRGVRPALGGIGRRGTFQVRQVTTNDQEPVQVGGSSVAPPRICILGGGFGGLYTAVKLDQLMWPRGTKPEITLIDQGERFVFKPLLYELLTDKAGEMDVAPPFRTLLAGTSVTFLQAMVKQVVPTPGDRRNASGGSNTCAGHVVLGDGTNIEYDWLVLALGSMPNKEVVPGGKEYALAFNTYEDAMTLKARLDSLTGADPPGTVLVVGSGYTGVELALAVKEKLGSAGNVQLVSSGQMVLPQAGQAVQRAATKALEEAGVEVLSDMLVSDVALAAPGTPPSLPTYNVSLQVTRVLGIRKQSAQIVVWTAGLNPATRVDMAGPSSPSDPTPPTSKVFPFPMNPRGQTRTEATLQVEGSPQVFALGDVALASSAGQGQEWLPPTAQVAFQQADYVAWNLWAAINGRKLLAFRYQHLGTMLAFGDRGGALALPFQLPPALANVLTNSPLSGIASTLGVKVDTDDSGVAVSGQLAAVARAAAYVYRQPTWDQQLRTGGTLVAGLGRAVGDALAQRSRKQEG